MAVDNRVGARCALECFDKDGNPRYCPPGSEFADCEVCRANMAAWSRRNLLEAKRYENQLNVRGRRMHEVTHPTKESYVARLKARRRRLSQHA